MYNLFVNRKGKYIGVCGNQRYILSTSMKVDINIKDIEKRIDDLDASTEQYPLKQLLKVLATKTKDHDEFYTKFKSFIKKIQSMLEKNMKSDEIIDFSILPEVEERMKKIEEYKRSKKANNK